MTLLFTAHVTMASPTMYHLYDDAICPASKPDSAWSHVYVLSCRAHGSLAWVLWALAGWRVLTYAIEEMTTAWRVGRVYITSWSNRVRIRVSPSLTLYNHL